MAVLFDGFVEFTRDIDEKVKTSAKGLVEIRQNILWNRIGRSNPNNSTNSTRSALDVYIICLLKLLNLKENFKNIRKIEAESTEFRNDIYQELEKLRLFWKIEYRVERKFLMKRYLVWWKFDCFLMDGCIEIFP